MKISNLRIEKSSDTGKCRVVCDIACAFSKSKSLYFEVDEDYRDWLTDDVYDAFLVAALYPCMYYNEPIEIRGGVTKRLYLNALHYVQASIMGYRPSFHKIEIVVKEFTEAQQNQDLHVGTGFSGGVDSFSTLQDWFFGTEDSDYKIDSLFFFHVGQYGNVLNPKTKERANKRFSITRDFAHEIGAQAVMMNTNLFDFYLPRWEYDAGIFCRICSVLVFQRALKRYYISNDLTYGETMMITSLDVCMSEHVNPYMMYLLSSSKTEIVHDGAQYTRTEKLVKIADNPFVQKFLNVCVNTDDSFTDAKNCGHCHKCLRTQLALESMDALEKFQTVFDQSTYRKYAFGYKCAEVLNYHKDAFSFDNVNFARAHAKKMPSYATAYAYITMNKLYHLPSRIFRKIRRIITQS